MWTVRLAWLTIALGSVLSGSAANAEQAFEMVQTVRGSHLHLFAPVSVNQSKVLWLLVDTGAPTSTISPGVLRSLALPEVNPSGIRSFEGNKPIRVVFAQSVKSMAMELGPGYFAQAPVAFARESTREALIAFNKEGILGMNFLVRHGAVINCRTQQIFFSRTGSKLPLTRKGYEKMGLTYVPLRITPAGYAEVEGTVAGLEYSFLVDTGAVWTTIDPWVREKYHLPIYRWGIYTMPYYGQTRLPVVMARVPELRIGNHVVSNELLCFGLIHSPPGGTLHRWGGLIGADLLFKRHAIIDLGNRALYLMADKKK